MTTAAAAMTSARLFMGERMLEQNGRGQCIDVAAAIADRSSHLANGSARRRRRETLVNELDGQFRALAERRRHLASLLGAWCFIAVAIQGQSHDESLRLELSSSSNDLGDRRALTCTAFDETSR